jgi:uncharacterized protein (TIGR01777 family)
VKIIVAGGTGQVGQILVPYFASAGHEIVVLARNPDPRPEISCASATSGRDSRLVGWDGKTLGPWSSEIDGADVLINLAGRSVNCRYHSENRKEIMDSRIDSTRVLGQAIENAQNPPKTWLQASTATIYRHRFDAPNDDVNGELGGNEPGAPDTWNFSIDVAKSWERVANEMRLTNTRLVLMRSAITFSPTHGGAFEVLLNLVRRGIGGTDGDGKQYVSWVHDLDFARAVQFLIEREDLSGPINIASPNPLPNRAFMKALREAWGIKFGLTAPSWLLEVAAYFMRTETELVLKSRRVVPTRLLNAGFTFDFPTWSEAARELVARYRLIP